MPSSSYHMMTSSNGNIFRVTSHLCGEFTGPRWIPRTKASDAELWLFFDLRLNKPLSKQSWGWWFQTLSCPLWRQCNDNRDLIRVGGKSELGFSSVQVNPLWLDDAIWQNRIGSALAQVVDSCLMAPSHYLNQCWLIISEVQWQSIHAIFTRDTSVAQSSIKIGLNVICLKFHPNLSGVSGLINPISGLSANAQKLLDQPEARKRVGIQQIRTKSWPKLQSPIMSSPTKFDLNVISSLSANGRKLLNQLPGSSGISAEHNQKLIMDGEAHHEFVHQTGTQSNQWFVCKWAETAWLFRGQEMVGIQGAHQKLSRPITSLLTKFELNQISSVCANVQKALTDQHMDRQGNDFQFPPPSSISYEYISHASS